MPEISIIVPVYKVEKYLDRCVKSILDQTFTDFELILVEDGSPDNCPQMCDEWAKKDERIRVIHKENGGVSSARNAGLKIARGNYLGFVDSDDWIKPDMYETLYYLLENKQYGISVCGIERSFSDDVMINSTDATDELIVYTQKEYLMKILKVNTQESNHYPWNKLYRKEVFEEIFFPEGLAVGEDIESTFLTVLNTEKIIETKKIGYIYWFNAESVTFSKFDARQLDFLEVCNRIVEIANKKCEKEIIEYAQIFRYRADLGILCKIAISDKDRTFDTKVYTEKLLEDLRTHYRCLLKVKMPISRKIIMTLMCINYSVVATVLYVSAKIFRKYLWQRI